jgi:hypothetical protein
MNISNPLFGNTCGKLYNDKIIITARGKQTEILLEALKAVKFITRPTIKGLVFLLLPLSLFLAPLLLREPGAAMVIVLYVLGLLFTIISVVKMERTYALLILFKSGASKKIDVWHGNIMEAKKFAAVISGRLAKRG